MKPEHLLHIYTYLYRIFGIPIHISELLNFYEQIKFGCRVDAYKIVIIEKKNVGWMVVVKFFFASMIL